MVLEAMIRRERDEAKAEGKSELLVALVKDGVLSVEEALKRLDISKEEFVSLLKDDQ